MSRAIRTVILMLFVSSCGSGQEYTAPSNLDDVCSILDQRPTYLRSLRSADRRWGVSPHVLMAAMYQESKFVGNARTPYKYTLGVIPMGRHSSAYGYAQALDATWDEYKNGPGHRRARRDDFADASDFMAWYMSESSRRLDIPLNDARSQYLAYHEGRAGFSRGNYRSKPWLIKIADEVAKRADTYQLQMIACGKS